MRTATLEDYKQRMLRVLVHVQAHLDDELSLAELAGIACFSAFHFHRVFTGMMGESLKEHVRRLRLERAAVQLRLGAQPVTQVALAAGYATHESFTRAFKMAYGVAPRRFRASRKARMSMAAQSGVHYRGGKGLDDFKLRRSAGGIMDVKIKRLEPLRVAFMRHIGPYQEVGGTWEKLSMLLGKDGFLGGDSQFLGICHDDPEVVASQKLRYDACVSVAGKFAPRGEIGAQTIAGGEYAMTTHTGPYKTLARTWTRMMGEWLPRSGRELRDAPCFECYVNSPEDTEPEDLVTDIYVPLVDAPSPRPSPPRRGRGRRF